MAVTTRYQAAGNSHPGQKRQNNEDRFYMDPERGLFMVVDGVGGQAAGEKAAEIAVEMLRARLERPVGGAADRLREAIAVANNEIFEAAVNNPAWQGMACVLTVALVEEDRVTIGHVGDSRLYLLRPGEIRKVTPDHSPIGEREDHGELSEAEAMRHPRRNEVFRDVGSERHAPDDAEFIDVLCIPFATDYALLLCSDGLSDLVPSAEIRNCVERKAANPAAAVEALIDAANKAGGKDNITAVLVVGSEYAGAVGSKTEPLQEATPPRRTGGSFFGGRWAFLLYGLALGALAYQFAPRPSPPLPPAAARIWTVGVNSDPEPLTIAGALALAQPGDTVLVPPGNYEAGVQMKEGVRVLSQRPGEAVLRPPDGGGPAVSAITIGSGRLSGFRVEGLADKPLSVGVLCRDCGVEFDDLLITGATKAAVRFEGGAWGVLQASRLTQNAGPAVVIETGAHPRLLHNTIAGGAAAAVRIETGASPFLRGNVFLAGAVEPIWKAPGSTDDALTQLNYFWSGDKTPQKRKIRPLGP